MSDGLSQLDTVFLYLSTATTSQTIGCLAKTSDPVDQETLDSKLVNAVRIFPRLRRKLCKDSTEWLDTDIPPVSFTKSSQLRPDSAWLNSEFSDFLNPEVQPWRISLSDSRTMLLVSFHHSLADGIGGRETFRVFTDGAKHEREETDVPQGEREPKSDSSTPLNIRGILKEIFHPRGLKQISGKNSDRREIFTEDLSLSDMRKLKASLGCTLNELYLLLVTGGLRRYLLRHGLKLDDPRIILPVNTRPRALRLTLGNWLLAVGVNLPVSKPEISERLALIKDQNARAASEDSLAMHKKLILAVYRLPRVVRGAILRKLVSKTAFICTYVPESPRRYEIGGAKVEGVYGLPALVTGQPFAFSLLTYMNKGCFSLVTDPKLFPHGSELLADLAEEFRELLEGRFSN